jgi:hypothetical protein
MSKFSKAAEEVLAYHQSQGSKPAYASSLVGFSPSIPNEESLLAAYAELANKELIVAVDSLIGHDRSSDGQQQYTTLYRAK